MKHLKWINTAAFAAMLAVSFLANLIPVGGNTTVQVSEAYPSLFTPAPVTFAVWGVIWLLMALFVVYQWGVLDHGEYSTAVREEVGLRFALSCVLNAAWIFLWHYRLIGPSVVCILLLLLSLFSVRRRLGAAGTGRLQRLAARHGFSLYFGWVAAASLAAISVFLTQLGMDSGGFPAELRTAVLLLLGALIGALIAAGTASRRGDPVAALAMIWAYAGVLIRHISPSGFAGAHPLVITAAFLSEVILLAAVLLPVIGRSARLRDPCPEEE